MQIKEPQHICLSIMSSPIITVKVKETLELEKNGESEEEINIELEMTSETKGTKYRNRNDF